MNELLFYATIAVISILVMAKASAYAINAIAHYAKTTGISNYFIGFLVVSMGTTLPEFSTAVMGSFANQGKLILGDLIGASIIDVTLILGIVAILGKKLKVQGKFKGSLSILLLTLIPLILGIDGRLDTKDGFILLAAFGLYVLKLIRNEKSHSCIKKQVAFKYIWKDMFIFLGCMTALLLSARWLLISAIHISNILHIPAYLMGLIFLGLITAIPELTIAIKSVLGGMSSITFGNLLGSVIANTTFALGTASILRTIVFDRTVFIPTAMFMITAVFIGVLFLNKGEITWKEGIGLLLIYLTFVASQVFTI